MKRYGLLLGWMLLALSACRNAHSEYITGVALFVFDNATHQDQTLASAMNPNVPGVFCLIAQSMKSGAVQLLFENNQGLESSVIANAKDLKRPIQLGYNNGIIVGFSNLDIPAEFYAYDKECPNCFDPNAVLVRSKPLTMTSVGLARCGVCHREYNLNADGVVVKGDAGKKLTRYRAQTTGVFGQLAVH